MALLDHLLNSDMQREPAECIILVGGKDISQFYAYAKELTVSMSRKAPTTCTIVFDTMRDEFGQWFIQDSGVFRQWMEIEIIAAFGSSHEEQIMHGYIKDVHARLPEDMSAASVTVTAQDDSILLDRVHGQGSLSNEEAPATDGEVVKQLAGELHVVADVGMTAQSLNRNSPPVQLIRERAEANGFEFYVREKTLYFKALDLGVKPQQEKIMLYAGAATNCLSFSARYDGHFPDKIRVTRAVDSGAGHEEETFSSDLPLLGSVAANSEGMGLEPFVRDMQQPKGSSWEELLVQAQVKANENAWKVKAEGELDGSLYGHVLLTHKTVSVDGVGESDGGIYYVDEVTHRFSADGYRQKFKLIRNATGEIASVAGIQEGS